MLGAFRVQTPHTRPLALEHSDSDMEPLTRKTDTEENIFRILKLNLPYGLNIHMNELFQITTIVYFYFLDINVSYHLQTLIQQVFHKI